MRRPFSRTPRRGIASRTPRAGSTIQLSAKLRGAEQRFRRELDGQLCADMVPALRAFRNARKSGEAARALPRPLEYRCKNQRQSLLRCRYLHRRHPQHRRQRSLQRGSVLSSSVVQSAYA